MLDFSYWRRAMVLSGLVPSVRVSSEQRLLRQRFPTSQASLIKYIPHFPVWKQKTWRIWLIICYPILGFFREQTVVLSEVGFGKRKNLRYLLQLKPSSQQYKSKWHILLHFNALGTIHILRKHIFRIFGPPST